MFIVADLVSLKTSVHEDMNGISFKDSQLECKYCLNIMMTLYATANNIKTPASICS